MFNGVYLSEYKHAGIKEVSILLSCIGVFLKEGNNMFFFKKKETPVQYTLEQAMKITAEELPYKLAESYAVVIGNYDEYHRRNLICGEAIKSNDRNTYDQYDFLRRNSLHLAINEINRVSDYLQKKFNVSVMIYQDSIEEMIDTIADFCEVYHHAECQEAACFR